MDLDTEEDRPIRFGDRVAKAIDNPWAVIASLLLVFAVFGIPLIWISKAFPTWGKVVLTLAVTVYTGLLLWGFWLIMLWSYHRIINAL